MSWLKLQAFPKLMQDIEIESNFKNIEKQQRKHNDCLN